MGTDSIQSDAFAKVVVGSTGISQIEIVAGGKMADPAVVATRTYKIKCDTRLNTDLTCTQATGAPSTADKIITVVAGANTRETTWNVLTVSAIIGKSLTASVAGTGFCASNSGVRRNLLATCVSTNELADTNTLMGVRFDCTCDGSKVMASCKVVGGGSGTTTGSISIAVMIDAYVCTVTGGASGAGTAVVSSAQTDINTFYHVAGFYDTGTPKFFVDALHEGLKNGDMAQASGALTIMGGISGISHYYYRGKCGVNEVQMFHDLNSMGAQGAGTGRSAATVRETASLVVGEGGAGSVLGATQTAAHWYVEHAQKYQYAGRGFDQLTVTPAPDRMSGQKIVVTYRGAAGSCSVKEVDRGTHESAVCSGRGNCDGATGTCVCDEGYTLEACSEQTVLV